MGAWATRRGRDRFQFTRRCPYPPAFPLINNNTTIYNGGQTISILGQPLWQPSGRWRAGCDGTLAHSAGAGRLHHGIHPRQRLHLQVHVVMPPTMRQG
jgi:hypothetical protein